MWRLAILHPFLVSVPDLQGTWRGEVVPTYTRGGEAGPASIPAYLVVRQSLRNLRMTLMTERSASEMLSADLVRDANGQYAAHGVYRNTPNIFERDGGHNPIHHGGWVLRVHGDPARVLDGEYWADRDSKGRTVFKDRRRAIAVDYAGASEAFGAAIEGRSANPA